MSAASTVASVIRYESPRARNDATAWLGMAIFIGSWSMMFAALFFAYAALRIRAGEWPPPGTPPLPVLLPAANTLVLAASGAALQAALAAARRGRLGRVVPAIATALVLGTGFVALQGVLWTGLQRAGLRVDGGAFASIFYALTVFHALHVVVGLFALVWLLVRARGGGHNPGRHVALRLWTAYWHFVGVVWLVLYATVFVF